MHHGEDDASFERGNRKNVTLSEAHKVCVFCVADVYCVRCLSISLFASFTSNSCDRQLPVLAVLNCFHVRVSCPGDGGNSIKLQREPIDTARDGHELGQAEERNSGWCM